MSKLLFLLFFISLNSEKLDQSIYSVFLIDENEYVKGNDYSELSETIFLLNSNYDIQNVEFFCNQLSNLYEREEERKYNFKKNNPTMVGWLNNSDLLSTLKYSIVVHNCGSYKKFKELSSGDLIKEIKIKSTTYNDVYPNEDTTVFYTYKIVKHYW